MKLARKIIVTAVAAALFGGFWFWPQPSAPDTPSSLSTSPAQSTDSNLSLDGVDLQIESKSFPPTGATPSPAPEVAGYIMILPPETVEIYHALAERYPETDLWDSTRIVHLRSELRSRYGTRMLFNERDEYAAAVQELENIHRELIVAKAEVMGLPVSGTDDHGRPFLLDGFDGPDPIYAVGTAQAGAAATTASLLRRNATFDPLFSPAIDGSELHVAIFDAGEIYQHVEFQRPGNGDSRITHAGGGSFDTVNRNHMTSVAGIVAAHGYDPNAMGMAPALEFGTYVGQGPISAVAVRHPGDGPHRSVLGTTSLAYIAPSCAGLYDTYARDFDQQLFDHPYYLHFFGAGNSGPDWHTLSRMYPTAKNLLLVGATGNITRDAQGNYVSGGAIQSYSSCGPTRDGRIKPDLVAKTNTRAPIGTSGYTNNFSGTSAATPLASGSTVLLIDYFNRRFPGQFMRSSTVRALLTNTADDLGNPGPDYTYGWGHINISKAAEIIRRYADNPASSVLVEGTLNDQQIMEYPYISDGSGPIRVTLAWTDLPGPAFTIAGCTTASPLVNNLHLRVIAPGGTAHYPFVMPYTTGNGQHDAFSAELLNAHATTGINNIDNVIQVLIPASAAGEYTVEVSHTGTLGSDSQVFSLALSGLERVEPLPAPVIDAVTPRIRQGDFAPVEVMGQNFALGSRVLLRRAGQSEVAGGVEVESDRLALHVDTAQMQAGYWDVIVRNPDGQEARLPNGLLVALFETVWSRNMDSNPGFTLEGDWQYGAATGVAFAPSSGYTGSHILATNLSGVYAPDTGVRYATSPAISASGRENLVFNFQRWFNAMGPTFAQAGLEFSADGGTVWHTLWQHTAQFNDGKWTAIRHDLPPELADGADDLRFRFFMGPTGGFNSNNYSGWHLDDLTLEADLPPPAMFTSAPVESAVVGGAYSYWVTVADDHQSPETLTLSADGLPAWLTFTAHGNGTATLSGTPQSGDVGLHTVFIRVTNANYTTWHTFQIGVYPVGATPGTNTAPVVAIHQPTSQSVIHAGQTITFIGLATDAEDGDLASAAVWTSSIDGELGTGIPLSATLSTEGSHTITLSVTDSVGWTRTTSVMLEIGEFIEPYVPPTPEGTVTHHTGVTTYDQADWRTLTSAQINNQVGLNTGNNPSGVMQTFRADEMVSVGAFVIVVNNVNDSQSYTLRLHDFGTSAPAAILSSTEWTETSIRTSGTVTVPAGTKAVTNPGGTGNPSTVKWTLATPVELQEGRYYALSAANPSSSTSPIVWRYHGGSGAPNLYADGITYGFSGGSTWGTGTVFNASWNNDMSLGLIFSTSGPANTAPSVTITAPDSNSTVTRGDSVTFTGTATDAEDYDTTLLASAAWTSSLDGALGTGGSISTADLSVGTHTITFAVTDSGGLSDTEQMTLTVQEPLHTGDDPAQPENPGGGTGTTYYLDVNTGSDSNSGLSEAEAWQTFQHAINTLQPGDTVLIREGDYTSTGNPEQYNWSINTSGTPGQYITYRAYPGERPRFHVDTWNGLQLWEVSHIEIAGLEIIGLPDPEGLAEEPEHSPARQALVEDPQYVGGGITVAFDTGAHPHFIRIRNNLVHQVGGNGIGFRGGSMILVEGNTVHSSTHRSDAGNSAISFVELNSALHQSEGYGVVVRDNTLFNNRNMLHFKDFGYITDGNGVIIDFCQDYTGDRILIASNLIHHNGGRGVHVFNARNVDIIHNTLFHNLITGSLQWAGELSSDAPGGETNNSIHFHNNISVARADRRAYNIANTTNWQFTRNVTQSPRAPETTVDSGQNLLQTDPLFVDSAVLDFRLQSASPAIDYGLVFAGVPVDFDGNERQGGAPDAGAFEFVGGLPPPVSMLVRYSFENVPAIGEQHSADSFTRQADAESVAEEITASPFYIQNHNAHNARLIATDADNGIAGAAQIAGIQSDQFQWESGASGNPYFEFTLDGVETLETLRIVARSGSQWNNTGAFLSYDSNRRAEISVRSSLDNYASNIAPVFVAGNAGAFAEQILDLASLNPAGQSVTFRIYTRAYESPDGWYRTQIDQVEVTGLVGDAHGGDPYELWAAENNITGSLTDLDEHGIPNLLRYALGGTSETPPETFLLVPVVNGSGMSLSFPRVDDPALIYEVWATDDLLDWGGAPFWSGGGGAPAEVSVPAAGSRLYLHLRVRRP